MHTRLAQFLARPQRLLLLPALVLVAAAAPAASLDQVLAGDEAPPGVVIEIIRGSEQAWDELMPELRDTVARLRARFPGIDIAVVSHGQEQFGITAGALRRNAALGDDLRRLGGDALDLHVCGAHASWYGVTAEDYPAFIDVSASGPAQINAYRDLGYILLDF